MVALQVLAIALWAVMGQAQRSSSSYVADITFYDSNNSSNQCSQNSTAISIQVQTVPEVYTCFNLSTTFDSSSTVNSGPSCRQNNSCPINYALVNANNYNPQANYSQVLFTQQGSGAVGPLVFQTYAGVNCLQATSVNDPIEPWVRWSCNVDGACDSVPYNIGSFAILAPLQNSDGHCVTAAAYGTSAAVGRWWVDARLVWVTVAALGYAVLH